MKSNELRQRLERLGRPFTQLAPLLGLSIDGLNKQMNGARPVSRQTELLLDYVEATTARGGKLRRETTHPPHAPAGRGGSPTRPGRKTLGYRAQL